MNTLIKNTFFGALIVLALAMIYTGSYLPWAKSTRYISANRSMSSVKTFADFENNYDRPLKFYSPIGQEEVTKFLSGDILGLIAQNKQPEEVDRALVEYIEPYAFQNNVRHMIVMGQMYLSLAKQFGRPEYMKKAEDYYLKARAIGPKLPPVLYGLLTIYQAEGDQVKFTEVAQTILSLWPNDSNLSAFMKLLESKPAQAK